MEHTDHVRLLQPAGLAPGGIWADLGAGSGAFSLALRELVGEGAEIFAVDRDRRSLDELERAYSERFGDTSHLHLLAADFSRPMKLPALDGALMANSLHFFRREAQVSVVQHVRAYLKPGGAFLLVEYNVDSGNMWVPHPLSFKTWQRLASQAGLSEPRLLATHPSHFLREFFSALSHNPAS